MRSDLDHRHCKDHEVTEFICKQRHSKKRGYHKSKDPFDSLFRLGSGRGITGVILSCLSFLSRMVKFQIDVVDWGVRAHLRLEVLFITGPSYPVNRTFTGRV